MNESNVPFFRCRAVHFVGTSSRQGTGVVDCRTAPAKTGIIPENHICAGRAEPTANVMAPWLHGYLRRYLGT